MSEGVRLLCEMGLSVSVGGGGGRTLLQVSDGRTIRFWTETEVLEDALDGVPARFATFDGFCRIEVEGEETRLEFGMLGEESTRCAFPRADLEEAVAWIRGRPSPHETGEEADGN